MNLFSRTLTRTVVTAVDKELHKPQKGDGKTVHLPKLLLIIGIISTSAFLVPSVYAFFGWKTIGGGLAFLAISLFCSTLITAYVNQRIYYDDEGFTAKSFFGVKRRYSYSDIEYTLGIIPHDLDKAIDDENFDDIDYVLDLMSEDIKLKIGKRKILVDQIAVGGIEFLAFAQKQYKLRNGGKPIPSRIKTTKCDAIFNGNVKNATAQVVIYIVVFVLWMGMLIIIPVTNVPTEMEDLTLKTVTAEGYETDDEYLYLDIDGFEDDIFLRGYTETFDDSDGFISILDRKEPIEIGYETVVDDGETYHRIEYVRDKNGNVLTTPEDFHEFYQRDVNKIIILLAAIILLWVLYVMFTIYVGRNPHKFSPKFVHKFFKEGTIRL